MNVSDETEPASRSYRETDRPACRRLLPDGGESESEDETEDDEGEETEAASAASESPDESEAESDDAESEANAESEAGEEEETEEAGSSGDEEADYREEEGTTVLFLDLEGLFLDLLGLEVDLEEVELDVSAVTGEGRLLGNLLSSVADLLGAGDKGLLGNLFGGSLFEGLLGGGDDDGGGLFGGFLGGSGGSDDEESEEGQSVRDRVSGSVSDAFSSIPLDELLTTLLKELVDQFFGEEEEEGEAEGSESTS